MAYDTKQRRVCQALLFQRSNCRCHSVADEEAALRIRLRDLASSRVSYGYRRLHILLQREAWEVNQRAAEAEDTRCRSIHRVQTLEW